MQLCPVSIQTDALDGASPLPISLDLVKEHCGIDGDDQDATLELYLIAAIQWAEAATHRTIVQRGHRFVLEDFPSGDAYGRIRLPLGKTIAVEKIEVAQGNSIVTLYGPTGSPEGTGYREDLNGDDGGIVMPPYGGVWPDADQDSLAPVAIYFTAGWPADEIPKQLLHAILFAVSDAVELRGAADLQSVGSQLEAWNALVSAYALSRWY